MFFAVLMALVDSDFLEVPLVKSSKIHPTQ